MCPIAARRRLRTIDLIGGQIDYLCGNLGAAAPVGVIEDELDVLIEELRRERDDNLDMFTRAREQ